MEKAEEDKCTVRKGPGVHRCWQRAGGPPQKHIENVCYGYSDGVQVNTQLKALEADS
jgi:hypothetical protein